MRQRRMLKTMNIRVVLASACLLVVGCEDRLEQKFFDQPPATRLERMRQYSLPDDITLRDILLIFETMATSKSYDVRSDASLMTTLTSRVSGMKHALWQDNCKKMLQRITDFK